MPPLSEVQARQHFANLKHFTPLSSPQHYHEQGIILDGPDDSFLYLLHNDYLNLCSFNLEYEYYQHANGYYDISENVWCPLIDFIDTMDINLLTYLYKNGAVRRTQLDFYLAEKQPYALPLVNFHIHCLQSVQQWTSRSTDRKWIALNPDLKDYIVKHGLTEGLAPAYPENQEHIIWYLIKNHSLKFDFCDPEFHNVFPGLLINGAHTQCLELEKKGILRISGHRPAKETWRLALA